MTSPAAAVRPPSVLIVDDNHLMVKTLRIILESAGVTDVRAASSVRHAFEACRTAPPDVALIDHELSDRLDGVDLVRFLRMAPESPCATAPILMVTGFSDKTLRREALDAGVDEFLPKPVSARSLLLAMAEVLSRPRDFVRTPDYFGPDRRRNPAHRHAGPWRRRDDAARLSRTSVS